MSENPKTHRRLMHQFRQRISWAPWVSLFVAAGVVFCEWTGFGSRGGLTKPHPFNEIWWHFFVNLGIFFAFFMLWPMREEHHHETE
jgi:hypothetical protein